MYIYHKVRQRGPCLPPCANFTNLISLLNLPEIIKLFCWQRPKRTCFGIAMSLENMLGTDKKTDVQFSPKIIRWHDKKISRMMLMFGLKLVSESDATTCYRKRSLSLNKNGLKKVSESDARTCCRGGTRSLVRIWSRKKS